MFAKKRRLNVAFRIGLSLSLLYCIYLAGRQAVAAWYFQEQTPESIRKAIHWDPHNGTYHATLARILQFSPDQEDPAELIRLYETSTRLSPHQAQYWAGLAGAYEWAGRLEDAARAYERARQLFPNSPDINWSAANFYVRTEKTREALQALRKALLGDPEMRRHVFELAWHAGANSKLILEETVPDSPDILLPYISYLVDTQRMDEAEQAWSRLLERELRFEVRQAFPYLDALIQHRRVDHLRAAWGALAERFPAQVRGQSSDSDLATNGSFEQEILNGGLDWRITPVEGVVVRADNQIFFDGARSLRIEFDGRHNVEYSHVLQYVPVTPQTPYEFTGYMRVQGITTDSGPRFQICDAYDAGRLSLSTENLVGSSGWSPQRLEFRTGPDTHLLILRVARRAGHKFDNQIAGRVWVDRVSLRAAQEQSKLRQDR